MLMFELAMQFMSQLIGLIPTCFALIFVFNIVSYLAFKGD